LMANLPRFEIMCESEKLEKEIPSRFFFFAKRSALSRVCSSAFPAFLLLRHSVLGASSPGGVGAGTTPHRGAVLVTSSVSSPIGTVAPSVVAAVVSPFAGSTVTSMVERETSPPPQPQGETDRPPRCRPHPPPRSVRRGTTMSSTVTCGCSMAAPTGASTPQMEHGWARLRPPPPRGVA
jgi:hypothetical protein